MAGQGMTAAEAGGIINVRKPAGMTSFGVVARVRRMMGLRRVGHCGTLDPFAEGVLPILLGRATGMARYMDGYGKSYRVTVRFGSFTDTQDLTGKPVGGRQPTSAERAAMEAEGFAGLREAVASLVGERLQTPPMYSAVKIDGRHLYEYARKGIEVERAGRLVRIYRADLLEIRADGEILEATVDIDCSKGTYIRTLCQDLGESSGFGAHASALTRTACGPFRLDGAISLEELERVVSAPAADRWAAVREAGILFPLESAIPDMPAIHAGAGAALHFMQGRPVGADEIAIPLTLAADERVAFCGPAGFIGVGVIRTDEAGQTWIKAERVFSDREDNQ